MSRHCESYRSNGSSIIGKTFLIFYVPIISVPASFLGSYAWEPGNEVSVVMRRTKYLRLVQRTRYFFVSIYSLCTKVASWNIT